MMGIQARTFVVYLTTAVICALSVHAAHANQTDEEHLKLYKEIRANFDRLEGMTQYHKESIDYLMREVAKLPGLEKKIDDLTNQVELYKALNEQREAYVQGLIELACHMASDNCALRGQLEARESELRQRSIPGEGREKRAPTLAEPSHDIAPTAPDTSPYEVVPTPTPKFIPAPPRTIPWNGHLDLITDRPGSVDPNSTMIRRCLDYKCADGNVIHGNLYRTGDGYFIFLRHTRTNGQRSMICLLQATHGANN
jgi:hypothetical protein